MSMDVNTDIRKAIEEGKNKTTELKGWVCPVCGRGLSPWTSMCPCKGFKPDWKVTC